MSVSQNAQLPPVEKRSVGMQAWFTNLVKVFNAQMVPTPATDTSIGVPGQFAYDTSYLYICIAPNTWKRTAISTF